MALGEIKHNIEAQAEREAAAIRESALKEREAIMGEARAKVAEIAKCAERQIAEELGKPSEESGASTEIAEKNITLAAREEALEREAAGVRRRLVKEIKGSKSYANLFKAAVKQAREFAPIEELTIITSKPDKARVEGFGAKVEIAEMAGGLIIRSKSGGMELNASLDSLIDASADRIRSMLMEEMFGAAKKEQPAKAARRERKTARRAGKPAVRKPSRKPKAKVKATAKAKTKAPRARAKAKAKPKAKAPRARGKRARSRR
jgi:vacuolar-type H+-ATPase subunit E/Vma4